MLPFYFGSSGRSLFGIYEAPPVGGPSRGIVVCNTIGREYYFTHRTCRLLTERLAGAGLHALRFDQLGTGDSALELDEVTWDDWVGSVAEAVEELRDMAELSSVGLIGLRVGAEVAAEAAAQCNVDRLVLWDPVPDRSRFIRGALPPELAGCFPDDWASGNLTSAPLPSQTMLTCSRDDSGAYQALATELQGRCREFRLERTRDSDAWRTSEAEVGRLPVPVASIEAIVDWCRNT